jgi:hypothetical protein
MHGWWLHIVGAGAVDAEIDAMVQNGLAQWAARGTILLDTAWYLSHC